MLKIVLLILLVILGSTFATLNRQEISLHYLWGWNTGLFPLYVFILASLVVGLIVGFSYGWKARCELRSLARDLGEKVKSLKSDLQTLTQKEERPAEASPSPEVGKPPLA